MNHSSPKAGILAAIVLIVGVAAAQTPPIPAQGTAAQRPVPATFTLEYLVDIHGATFFVDDKDVHHGELEFTSLVYTPNGELVNANDNGIKLDIPDDQYEEMLKQGMRVTQHPEVPVKGEYFLRVGVHDIPGDRVGSVEVPLRA